MHRTLPTILRALLFSTVVVMVPCVVSPNSVMATVVIPEPNDQTARGSDIIAVCVVESVQGEPPFTQENPPDQVIFKVERAIKGCGRGDILRIFKWVSKAKPSGRRIGPSDVVIPPSDESVEEWKRTPVAVPQMEIPTLLFLTRSDGDTLRQYLTWYGKPVFFEHPSEEQLLLVTGLAWFELDINLSDWRFPRSSPVIVRGTLTNVSQRQRTFDPENIAVTDLRTPTSYPHPASVHPEGLREKQKLASITLEAGESGSFEWDLRDILGISGFFPGRYQVWVQAPAGCRKSRGRVRLVFWIVNGLDFEEAVTSCPFVFTATVKDVYVEEDETVKVALMECNSLNRKRLTHRNELFQWPKNHVDAPKVGDSLIVCVDGRDTATGLRCILYFAEKSEQLLSTARSLLGPRASSSLD